MSGFESSVHQLRAINCRKGYLAISACPGSGKTETISRRTAAMVTKDGVKPSSIVAFTFTTKAAGELRSRIRKRLGRDGLAASGMYIGTIDAFCLRALEELSPGYRGYGLLDEMKRIAYIDNHYDDLGLPHPGRHARGKKIKDFCTYADNARKGMPDDKAGRIFRRSLEEYTSRLDSDRLFDFVGVTSTLLGLLRSENKGAHLAQLGVRHLVVDEYQDVDPLQEELIDALSEDADSVCAVGDDDQTIFWWRGGDVRRLGKFREKTEDHEGAVVDLPVNYRSTDVLVERASALIEHNKIRIGSGMEYSPEPHNRHRPGNLVRKRFSCDEDEADAICDWIDLIHGSELETRSGARPITYGDIAILVRKNDEIEYMAKRLEKNNIPCEIVPKIQILEEPVVKLAADCLLYALGSKSAPAMQDLADTYAKVVPGGDPKKFMDGMAKAASDASKPPWRDKTRRGSVALAMVISAMGAQRKNLSGHERGLAALSRAVSEYEYVNGGGLVYGLQRFVKTLVEYQYHDRDEQIPSGDKVQLMTVWRAKGLEFPAVFVPTFLDGWNYEDEDPEDTENDRRVFYTAVTRSMRYLILTDTPVNPLRFAPEIVDDSFLEQCRPGPPSSPDSDAPQDPVQLTMDAVASYERCPHEYNLRHVIKYKEGLQLDFDYPRNVRLILDHIHTACRNGGEIPSGAELRSMVEDMFHLKLADRGTKHRLREKTIEMLEDYAREYRDMIRGNTGSDLQLGAPLHGAVVSDTANLLGPSGVTIFKVGSDAIDGHADHEERARFCAAAVSGLAGGARGSAVHYLHDRKRLDVDAGDSDLEGTRASVSYLLQRIALRDFKPAPEREKCNGCDFKYVCEHNEFL